MNAKIICSRVPCFSAVVLISLALLSFAGRAEAQPDTPPKQVIIQPQIVQPSTSTSRDLGLGLLDAPTPGLRNFQQNFAGFSYPQTLPLGDVEVLEGFGFKYRQQTRDDVKRTSYDYSVGDTLLQIGTGKGTELYFGFPIQNFHDTTIRDRTGEDSFSRNGNGDLRAGLQINFLGNDGGPFGLSMSVDGLIPTKSNNGNDFPRFFSTLNDTNNDNDTGRRDRKRTTDDYGLGVSVQATVDLPWGLQAGINSGVMLGHPDCCCCCCCCCCACFDNRFNVVKAVTDQWALEATVDTTVSTARHSDVQATILGGVRWTPTTWLGLYAGPTWNATENGDNIGGMFQASFQWDKSKW
jgi:hypothetical protein